MVFDTERFIVEIHKRPSLWHIDTEDYTNKRLKYQCWGEVAEIMFPEFGKLEEKQKFKKIRELKKKWKGLRDYYKRDHKSGSKTGINGKKRKTVCLDLLQFLSVTITNRTNTKNHKSIERNEESSSEHEPEESPSFPNIRQQKPDQNTTRDSDADMNFLLNILPDMKSMDARQNFEFRFGVMQLIKDIKYSENNIPNSGTYNQEIAPKPNVDASSPTQATQYCDILLDIKRSPSSDESVTSVHEDETKSIIIRFPENGAPN